LRAGQSPLGAGASGQLGGTLILRPPPVACPSMTGVPDGECVVLDVAQLEALLVKTFHIGLDVGRGKDKGALVRLRLSKALLGAVEAQALAAESIALEEGVSTAEIAQTDGLALRAGGCNGIPDPVVHLIARAMGIVTGLAALEPDPRAPARDAVLDAVLRGAAGLVKLLGFRRDCVTATTHAEQAQATAKLTEAGAELTAAADAVTGLLELARITAASGRTGKQNLN